MLKKYVAYSSVNDSLRDFLEGDSAMLRIAMKLFEKEFETYRKKHTKKKITDSMAVKLFLQFVDDRFDNAQDINIVYDTVYKILEVWTKEEDVPATIITVEYNHLNDYLDISVIQVIPTTKDDILELTRMYIKERNGMDELAELAVEKLIGE